MSEGEGNCFDQRRHKFEVHLDLRPHAYIEVRGDVIDVVVDDTVKLYTELMIRLGLEKDKPRDPFSQEEPEPRPEPISTPVVGTGGVFKPATRENVKAIPKCPDCKAPMRKVSSDFGSFFGCTKYRETGCTGKLRIP